MSQGVIISDPLRHHDNTTIKRYLSRRRNKFDKDTINNFGGSSSRDSVSRVATGVYEVASTSVGPDRPCRYSVRLECGVGVGDVAQAAITALIMQRGTPQAGNRAGITVRPA